MRERNQLLSSASLQTQSKGLALPSTQFWSAGRTCQRPAFSTSLVNSLGEQWFAGSFCAIAAPTQSYGVQRLTSIAIRPPDEKKSSAMYAIYLADWRADRMGHQLRTDIAAWPSGAFRQRLPIYCFYLPHWRSAWHGRTLRTYVLLLLLPIIGVRITRGVIFLLSVARWRSSLTSPFNSDDGRSLLQRLQGGPRSWGRCVI